MTGVGRPIHKRWYVWVAAVLLLPFIVVAAITTPLGGSLGMPYRTFYIPAESMRPTLEIDDKLIGQMRVPAELRRGMVLLVRVGDRTYVQRLVGLPGDTIELIDGDLYLNGEVVPRRRVGREPATDPVFGGRPVRYVEQLPGESGTHEILDSGYGAFDDVPVQRVRPGHVFLLGDNRDHIADSRVPRDEMGVEQLPVGDIEGIALSIYWRSGEGLVSIPLLH